MSFIHFTLVERGKGFFFFERPHEKNEIFQQVEHESLQHLGKLYLLIKEKLRCKAPILFLHMQVNLSPQFVMF